MLWSTLILFLLFSSVISQQSNWYNKINIEKNGQKYINIYAFSDMEFTMETSQAQNFNFTIKKSNSDVITIRTIFSTASSSNNVLCDIKGEKMDCNTTISPPKRVYSVAPLSRDEFIDLYKRYDTSHLTFTQKGSKYFLKISSNFTPVENKNLCPFLMEWPSTVTLRDSHINEGKKEALTNYEICEESEKCDGLKNKTGIKFLSKGILEFSMALFNKEKEYKLLHASGLNSPVFTIHGSPTCTEYTLKISFKDYGSILFKGKEAKINVETDFKPILQSEQNISIANNSDINFYFYKNYIYCNFFDSENHFQLRTFKLPNEKNEETNIQIDYSSTVKECNETLKLIVGNDVNLLFPKRDTFTSTHEPENSTESNINETKEKVQNTEDASFPLGALIVICCIGGILLLGCLALIIYCGIRKYKKRKNTKTLPKKTSSINKIEKKMQPKKPKKSKKNKNDAIEGSGKKTKEEFSIIYGKPTESFPTINVNGENEKVQQKLMQQKIERMKKKYGSQRNQDEKNTTEEDGEEVVGEEPNKKTITKSKTVTKTETIEGGATQTTQNSVQISQSSTQEDDSKPSKMKSKTKTFDRNGTAPTQASGTAENLES